MSSKALKKDEKETRLILKMSPTALFEYHKKLVGGFFEKENKYIKCKTNKLEFLGRKELAKIYQDRNWPVLYTKSFFKNESLGDFYRFTFKLPKYKYGLYLCSLSKTRYKTRDFGRCCAKGFARTILIKQTNRKKIYYDIRDKIQQLRASIQPQETISRSGRISKKLFVNGDFVISKKLAFLNSVKQIFFEESGNTHFLIGLKKFKNITLFKKIILL